MTTRPDAEILDEMMLIVQSGAMYVARHEELRVPLLLVRTPEGTYLPFSLAEARLHPGEQAQILLHGLQATHAALCIEAWAYEMAITPEQKQALAEGEHPIAWVQPKDHPERVDLLNVIGETRGQPQIVRSWLITTTSGTTTRTFTARQDGGESLPSRFNPLFVDAQTVHDLVLQQDWLEHLHDQTRSGRN